LRHPPRLQDEHHGDDDERDQHRADGDEFHGNLVRALTARHPVPAHASFLHGTLPQGDGSREEAIGRAPTAR